MSDHRSFRLRLAVPLLAVLLIAGCANDGIPESWDDQADDSGTGLAIRQFHDACAEANDDLTSKQSQDLCRCVLKEIRTNWSDAESFEKFAELDGFITKHRDELNPAMLTENFGWFTSAVGAC